VFLLGILSKNVSCSDNYLVFSDFGSVPRCALLPGTYNLSADDFESDRSSTSHDFQFLILLFTEPYQSPRYVDWSLHMLLNLTIHHVMSCQSPLVLIYL
jgi:hypothetical protein